MDVLQQNKAVNQKRRRCGTKKQNPRWTREREFSEYWFKTILGLQQCSRNLRGNSTDWKVGVFSIDVSKINTELVNQLIVLIIRKSVSKKVFQSWCV